MPATGRIVIANIGDCAPPMGSGAAPIRTSGTAPGTATISRAVTGMRESMNSITFTADDR